MVLFFFTNPIPPQTPIPVHSQLEEEFKSSILLMEETNSISAQNGLLSHSSVPSADNFPPNNQHHAEVNPADMSARLAKLGLAAVLAYGLFDAVAYTSFFVFAFLGFEKSTGKNPAANIKAL